MTEVREFGFEPDAGRPAVTALLQRPADAFATYLLAHGAGAGMRHHFMEDISVALAGCGVATLRYNFPYTEVGRRRPDHRNALIATVRSACAFARVHVPDLPLFAGGKSMGGRMTSQADAAESLGTKGLVFLGFPLHPAGKEGVSRAAHLPDTDPPLLFIQGTRDKLANLELLAGVLEPLAGRATLHVVDHADHGLALPKRQGRPPSVVLPEVAAVIAAWMRERLELASRSAASDVPPR